MMTINANKVHKTVRDSLSGLIKRIVKEEADAASRRVMERVTAEAYGMTAEICAVGDIGGNNTHVTIIIDPPKATEVKP